MAEVIIHLKDGSQIIVHKEHAVAEARRIQSDIERWVLRRNAICLALPTGVVEIDAAVVDRVEVKLVGEPGDPESPRTPVDVSEIPIVRPIDRKR
jgi:hypothetical protein